MQVLIYGATGLTGGLIAESLKERGVHPILCGRDQGRLEALASRLGSEHPPRVAAVHDPESLARSLDGIDVVINCAGPFTRLGMPVVSAAIEAGAHYFDTTGEQAFMQRVYEQLESRARRAEVAVVNGFAYEIALGDWCAALVAARLGGEVDELAVAYTVDDAHLSAGTQLSAIESMSQPNVVWNLDRWEPVAPAAETRLFSFPAPFGERLTMSFPSGEVISVPRHVRARRVQTYICFGPDSPWSRMMTRTTQVLGVAIPVLMRSPLGAWARSRAGSNPAPPTESARARTRFAVVAEASRGFERARVTVTGADPYGVTAVIAAFGLEWLGAGKLLGPKGVLAPSEAFDAEASLAAIADACGLEVARS